MGGGILPISFKDGKIYFFYFLENLVVKNTKMVVYGVILEEVKKKMRHFYKQLYVKVGKKAMVY